MCTCRSGRRPAAGAVTPAAVRLDGARVSPLAALAPCAPAMPHGATYESMPAWWQLTFGVLSFLVVLYCVKIDDNEELQRRTQEQEHDQQHGHRRSKQKAH